MQQLILHVDNEITTLDLVCEILTGAGFKVVSAKSGQECLDKLAEIKPSLVLLDIMMPDLSGWDVYQRIRKTDKELKVAFLSVVEVSAERRKSLIESGLSDYILKPFVASELISRVTKIIGPGKGGI